MTLSFSLNLPTDIPWRRICVSQDMLDPVACDKTLPPRWRSSLAVFRYDPADEYQPYPDLLISYLKVAVSIVPYAPELSVDLVRSFTPPVLIDDLQEAFPCYGALLHVTVTPGRGVDELDAYPYFIDFEPKKRELYETVTDTGEVLSGSSTAVKVGKSATSTDTTENYNLDTGWNFGMQASYAGTGGGFNVGETGQWGTVNRAGLENTNLRQTDTSAERRELQSHTTQLAQMYNLFQAFHLGTNRALFFMEPRPHIRQSEATFINGPRALEGLQEIFLTVVRPKATSEFCVGVVLETAHLTKEPRYETEETEDLFDDFRLTATAENRDDNWASNDFTSQPVSLTKTYTAPPGYEIIGYTVAVLNARRVASGPTVTYTANTLSVTGSVTWRFWEGSWSAFNGYEDHYENGILDVNVVVRLRKKERTFKEFINKLFLSARRLCCCPEEIRPVSFDPSITYVGSLPTGGRVEIYNGASSRETFIQSRKVADAIRKEMLRSNASARRFEYGAVAYEESDAFFTRVADVLMARRITRELFNPAEESTVLSGGVKGAIGERLGRASLGDILTMDAYELGSALGVPHHEALAFKKRTLLTIGRRIEQASAAPADPRPTVPNVVGGSLKKARAALTSARLRAGDVRFIDSTEPEETVLNQYPEAGQSVVAGTDIDLVVASGATVVIPRVIGRALGEARQRLAQAGLRLAPRVSFAPSATAPRDQVLDVTPHEGTAVTPHTSVVLEVSSGGGVVGIGGVGGIPTINQQTTASKKTAAKKPKKRAGGRPT